MKLVEIDEDFGVVLNCAIRYCLGRQTYMPSLVIDFIRPLLPHLDNKTLSIIENDIKNPEIDWSKVEVDTKVLVSDDGEEWHKRHFARYEEGIVYVWGYGATSWTTRITPCCPYAKLAEEGAE